MIVEDIASQSSDLLQTQYVWRDPISGVHVSPGNGETLVMIGGILNNRSIACSLNNISA